MPDKKVSLKQKVIWALFGKPPQEGAETFNYQRRQSALVGSLGLLSFGFWIAVVAYAANASPAAGIAVAFGVLYYKLHVVAASASDAVFDSLWERTNLQSQYFDVRLNAIELKLGLIAGKSWACGPEFVDDKFTGDLADAYDDYPERTWRVRKQEAPDEVADASVV